MQVKPAPQRQPKTIMDIIFLNDLRIETVVGVYEWERKLPQTIQLDIEIGLPPAQPQRADSIDDTIDYAAVAARVRESLKQHQFLLIEAMAEHISAIILTEFGSPWTRVSITKLGLIRGIKRLGVCIERGVKPSS